MRRAGTLNNFRSRMYMFGRLFDKFWFTFVRALP